MFFLYEYLYAHCTMSCYETCSPIKLTTYNLNYLQNDTSTNYEIYGTIQHKLSTKNRHHVYMLFHKKSFRGVPASLRFVGCGCELTAHSPPANRMIMAVASSGFKIELYLFQWKYRYMLLLLHKIKYRIETYILASPIVSISGGRAILSGQ